MAFTIGMFFALIALYVLMFGLVSFAENVIAPPHLQAPANGNAARAADGAKPN